MIHREGFKIIGLTFLSLLAIVVLSIYLMAGFFLFLVVFAAVVILGLVTQFFRNPKRKTPQQPKAVIAPADGKVVVIEETEEGEYLKDKRIQVSIFMSPLNVHVNRNPVSGEVTYCKYHPGKYLVAWHPKSSTENERSTLVIKEKETGTEVLFRQIAGAVARRIRYYIHPEMKVNAGEEMGFIKFGSRIDVFLPLDAKINVTHDQKTKGGETVIAYLP